MIIQKDNTAQNIGTDPNSAVSQLQQNQTDLKMPQKMVIGEKEITNAIDALKKYKAGKESLERRIIENEQWFKLRHWEVMRAKYSQGDNANKQRPEPTSAWLFNAIANKHADAMDNYPDPNVLPREKDDEKDAKSLTTIIPVVLERNDYEQTYSDKWWYKLKMGTGIEGVFWDNSLENGLGDISIRKLDILNLFWEPGITDIQRSRNFFIVDLVDNDILLGEYPELQGKLEGNTLDVKQYVYDDSVDTTNKSVVVDWYYKKKTGTKIILHYVKFVGKTLLFSSENEEDYGEKGWYDHGQYPVVFDVMYPEEGTPFGFGFIDICKDPQMYVDKLNQIIIENALKAGRKRWFKKDNGGINEEEFSDWSKDFVNVSGSLSDDNLREIDIKQLDGSLLNFLTFKIDELKETAGNRDVNQGSTGGGVTAAAAIAALQEAGNKNSRDIIKASYRAFTKINYMCIELIRQFYSLDRTFRIEGTNGAYQYITYNNSKLVPQVIPAAVTGMQSGQRMPIFDIKIKPQRSNPFNRMAHNELAKELYGAGFFNPEIADQALIALDMMDFEGKEGIVDKINKNKTLLAMVMQLQERLKQIMGVPDDPNNSQRQPKPNAVESSANSQNSGGIMGAADNANTSYGEKIAERAKVKVND
jgi:hypothetical protein